MKDPAFKELLGAYLIYPDSEVVKARLRSHIRSRTFSMLWARSTGMSKAELGECSVLLAHLEAALDGYPEEFWADGIPEKLSAFAQNILE